MKAEIGDKIKFICAFELTTKVGEVVRILEEAQDARPRLLLVQCGGLIGAKQWVRPSSILSVKKINYEQL